MDDFFSGIPIGILVIALIADTFFIFILLLLNLANRSKFKRLKAKYYKFMNGLSDRNIEQLLEECINQVNEVRERSREIENHINYIDRNLLQTVQKVGIVRFNAFENMGSDLSFSIALLDNNDNGFVLSGIYSRDSSSTYAKPLVGGKSKYILSVEEDQAVDLAKKNYRERLYKD
jgi:hypothetical protein